MIRLVLLAFALALACRSIPPEPDRLSLTVWVMERSLIGSHYEALLRLRPLKEGYAYTFACTSHLVYRNDCPCPEARGVLPDSVLFPWMQRVIHLPDTIVPWANAPLTRAVIHGRPSRVIRYPANLLRDLFPRICAPPD